MKVRKIRIYVKGKRFDYPDYVVSRSGRVFRWTDGMNTWKGREINVKYFKKNEYPVVSIWDLKFKMTHKIRLHVIVAHTFLGKPPLEKEINHKDGVKRHCYVSNLEYLTRNENIKHSYDHGLRVSPMKGLTGDKCPHARMSTNKADEARRLFYAEKFSIEEIAKKFIVSISLIDKIIRGLNWNCEGLSVEQLKRKALRINNAQTKACRRS